MMAIIDYEQMEQIANDLLSGFGKQFYVKRPGKVERVNGVEVKTPGTIYTITGVVAQYKPFEINGKTIISGDMKLAATARNEVQIGDVVKVDGKDWRIMEPGPAKPAEKLICYVMQLRAI